jgi:hypothetical protein
MGKSPNLLGDRDAVDALRRLTTHLKARPKGRKDIAHGARVEAVQLEDFTTKRGEGDAAEFKTVIPSDAFQHRLLGYVMVSPIIKAILSDTGHAFMVTPRRWKHPSPVWFETLDRSTTLCLNISE